MEEKQVVINKSDQETQKSRMKVEIYIYIYVYTDIYTYIHVQLIITKQNSFVMWVR